VAALPAGSRVVDDLDSGEESRIDAEHILDRACIGHCFSYEITSRPAASFAYERSPATRLSMSSPPSNRMARATRNPAKISRKRSARRYSRSLDATAAPQTSACANYPQMKSKTCWRATNPEAEAVVFV